MLQTVSRVNDVHSNSYFNDIDFKEMKYNSRIIDKMIDKSTLSILFNLVSTSFKVNFIMSKILYLILADLHVITSF